MRTPGCSTVPRAVRVIARTSRASILIVSKRRAMSVVAFSTQSLRRSASRAINFAIASLVRARRLEPRLARASRCCSTFNRLASPRLRPGTCNNSPLDSATVDTDHAAVARTGDGVRDVGERDMPAAGPITGDTVGLDARGHRPRQAEPNPAHLGHPYPTQPAVQTLDVMPFHRDLPEPFVHISFAPPWATVRAGEEISHGLREI